MITELTLRKWKRIPVTVYEELNWLDYTIANQTFDRWLPEPDEIRWIEGVAYVVTTQDVS